MDTKAHVQNDKVQAPSLKKAFEFTKKWANYCADRRNENSRADAYRIGPIPAEDLPNTGTAGTKRTYGTLDDDVENLEFEEDRSRNGSRPAANKKFSSICKRWLKTVRPEHDKNLASSQALIVYFATLGKDSKEHQTVDLKFVSGLLENGADINFSDRYGQTILHEIARGWHPDVAKFAIQHGADINQGDYFGRTPLHLTSAVNYPEMVEFLVMNGGKPCWQYVIDCFTVSSIVIYLCFSFSLCLIIKV